MSLLAKLIPSLAMASVFAACGDDKGSSPAASDRKALLTAVEWKLTSRTVAPPVDYEGDGVMVSDLYAVQGACANDDVLAFEADGTFSVDEGDAKCMPEDPQVEPGTWTLAGDTLTMTSDLDGAATEFRVVEATASTLKVTQAADWDDGVDHTETLVFKAR